MATVFKSPGRNTYTARVRLWDAGAGKWQWMRRGTGQQDKGKALAVAVVMENASTDAKGGTMTRQRAEEAIAAILHMAGVPFGTTAPTLERFGNELFDERESNIGRGTRLKYAAHWKRLKKWAGERMQWPLDRWTADLCRIYYKDLRASFSVTNANSHMGTLAMIFKKAAAAGHVRGNPVMLIEQAGNDSIEKQMITRAETVAVLKAMRGNDPWRCLTMLGWYTGHRLQDLLSLTGKNVQRRGKLWTVAFAPAKKAGKGRTVVLPIPGPVARLLKRLGDFSAIHGGKNTSGHASTDFIAWMKAAKIANEPVQRGAREIHPKSFHSFRHSMASRLTAAGVSGELARLVTDHESKAAQKGYVHAEVEALAGALKKARNIKSS
jgi:integrase